jgi:pyruvate dehydrogenase E1 component alpha subunit
MSAVRTVQRGKPPESLRTMWEQMTLVRAVDDALIAAQHAGKVAYYSSARGEEAVLVAMVNALRTHDWIFPSSREVSVCLLRGMSLEAYLGHFFGNVDDPQKGRQKPNLLGSRAARVAPVSGTISSHVPQAVGFAWAAQKSKDKLITLASFGDGATSQGEFHNGANFAGVFKVPTVLLCRNNGRANSMPVAQQTRVSVLAEKCVAYGIAGLHVDGTDTLAVLAAVHEAVAHAEQGRGATLIEAVTVPDTIDPLVLLSQDALAVMSASEQADYTSACAVRVAEAMARAEARPLPERSTLVTDVYRDVPAHLKEAFQ